jgi:hypothetical protein
VLEPFDNNSQLERIPTRALKTKERKLVVDHNACSIYFLWRLKSKTRQPSFHFLCSVSLYFNRTARSNSDWIILFNLWFWKSQYGAKFRQEEIMISTDFFDACSHSCAIFSIVPRRLKNTKRLDDSFQNRKSHYPDNKTRLTGIQNRLAKIRPLHLAYSWCEQP